MIESNKDRIIVALDVSTSNEALRLADEVSEHVGMFKVGLQLFCNEGPSIITKLVEEGRKVFLDLKLHDIPNTVGNTVKVLSDLGVFMINVHIAGGKTMMKNAAEVVKNMNLPSKPLVIGVTVLTSMNKADLIDTGIHHRIDRQVGELSVLAQECGLDGVVASPREVVQIRDRCGKDFVIVTPGVSPYWAGHDDQKIVHTPAKAVKSGADYLVIGRPITKADNPKEAAKRIVDEIDALCCK